MSDADETSPRLALSGIELRVRGLVQGVGFRPTVWRMAHDHGLVGEVLNDGAGVLIRAWGPPSSLQAFEASLVRDKPPLARIDSVASKKLTSAPHYATFEIAASEAGTISTGIVPDAATCPACLEETFDPASRRYRYTFTNCTHCGPRLSIIRAIPYDRQSTSMACFPMCETCRAEYENPRDRRFHAEPIACPDCGPRVWLEDQAGEIGATPGQDALRQAAHLVAEGHIVAIKGIGGFHLACDAANDAAVTRLRQRKRRFHKPFALMARDLAMIRSYASITDAEAALLASASSPIVVLDRRQDARPMAAELAPAQTTLGFMLPYTPLHHILMQDLASPIVLTSGNVSDEPQCIANSEARTRLASVADYWLMHDRDIVTRLDDSVLRTIDGAPALLRRARGMAPEPLVLHPDLADSRPVLALGAELKSTFCLLAEGSAIVSQHIGDLEDVATHADFRSALELYRRMFAFDPGIIAVDAHPDYLSTQWGHALARETGASLVKVQHHHAHVAAVLAEHGEPAAGPPVLGIVLDGLGLGDNGELWGGEFLSATYGGFERLAAFTPTPLIGGNRAAREPWRNAFAHLHQAFGWTAVTDKYPDLEIVRLIAGKQPAVLASMAASGLNSPRASSAGRLFDAIAAVIGIDAERVSYEGQAAIELEALSAPMMPQVEQGYPFELIERAPHRLGWVPFWQALLDDVASRKPMSVIAGRAHRAIIDAVAATALTLSADHSLATAVLSGGVFQNRLLTMALRTHSAREA